MKAAYAAAIATLGAVLGGILVPGLAQSPQTIMPERGMSMGGNEHGMSGGMMGRSCAGMMQSIGGGGQRPNSQWRASPPATGSMLD